MKSFKSSSGSASSGQLYILVNGVLTPVGIDKTNPANTVAIPTLEAAQVVDHQVFDTASTPISNASWVQFVASTSTYYGQISIVNKTGTELQLATGASGSEVALMNIPSDGVPRSPVDIKAGTRLSLKATQATTASAGLIELNGFA